MLRKLSALLPDDTQQNPPWQTTHTDTPPSASPPRAPTDLLPRLLGNHASRAPRDPSCARQVHRGCCNPARRRDEVCGSGRGRGVGRERWMLQGLGGSLGVAGGRTFVRRGMKCDVRYALRNMMGGRTFDGPTGESSSCKRNGAIGLVHNGHLRDWLAQTLIHSN
jgi:hypothetical protein